MAATPGGATGRGAALKIVFSVLAVTLAIGFLLTRSMKEGAQYYKHVDEVMANPDGVRGKRLQVHGNVVPGSIEQVKGSLQYRFKIESRPPRPGMKPVHTPCSRAVITAVYTGLVPDTFKSDAEVVATGTLTGDNVLAVQPEGIMAKCPSKYDAEQTGPSVNAGTASAQKL